MDMFDVFTEVVARCVDFKSSARPCLSHTSNQQGWKRKTSTHGKGNRQQKLTPEIIHTQGWNWAKSRPESGLWRGHIILCAQQKAVPLLRSIFMISLKRQCLPHVIGPKVFDKTVLHGSLISQQEVKNTGCTKWKAFPVWALRNSAAADCRLRAAWRKKSDYTHQQHHTTNSCQANLLIQFMRLWHVWHMTHDQAPHCLSTSHPAEACGERPSPRRQSLANKICTESFSSFHQENRCPLESWTQTPDVDRVDLCGHGHVGLWVEFPASKTFTLK